VEYDINQAGGHQLVNAFQSLGYNYDSDDSDGYNGIAPSAQIGVLNPARPGGIRTTSWDIKVQQGKF
jgi:hypothetical protein